jgi:hypothetical protein
MDRIEAIKRLRELADKLESATDAPHDGHGGFTPELAIFTDYAKPSERNAVADYWIANLGTTERRVLDNSLVYRESVADGRLAVFVSDIDHHPQSDLLAGRDVQLVEIGGGE